MDEDSAYETVHLISPTNPIQRITGQSVIKYAFFTSEKLIDLTVIYFLSCIDSWMCIEQHPSIL